MAASPPRSGIQGVLAQGQFTCPEEVNHGSPQNRRFFGAAIEAMKRVIPMKRLCCVPGAGGPRCDSMRGDASVSSKS